MSKKPNPGPENQPEASIHDGARPLPGTVPRLAYADRRILLALARQALTDYLDTGKLPSIPRTPPSLLDPGAAFVTLRRRGSGELRGCRGEVEPRRPLAEAVMLMVVAAATDDPRFPPVTLNELPDLIIEISVLTPVRPIRPEEIVVGRHGLLIRNGDKRGLLLPQVPLQLGWSRDRFLAGLCQKAGLPEDGWRAGDAQLYGFETEAWGDEGT